jgi:hypothetical protein
MPEAAGETAHSMPSVGSGAIPLTTSEIAAAFRVGSCCGLPFLFGTTGLSAA